MEETDILVIGAGIVGLAIAKELSFGGGGVTVVEKNISFGQETSSRNSEVMHGGMYYPSGTLKAKLCVDGRRLLYKFCNDNKVPHKKIGKLIVATTNDEIADLEKLFKQGEVNGVEGLQLITEAEIKKLEPKVSGIAALYSRETGIVDSHRLMECLLMIAKRNMASIVYDAEVVAIEKIGNGYKVTIKNAGEVIEMKASIVINSAGLDSDTVAGMMGIDVIKEKYDLHYCKGQYFRIASEKSVFIKHLVYPVPHRKSGGLGIHVTPDLGGSVRLGPDDRYLNNRIKDYSVDEKVKGDFFRSVVRFIPFLEENDLVQDLSGIRPKLQSDGGDFRDFVICDERDKGFPGFINLIGIESPGLTASSAIAGMVKEMVSKLSN